LAYNIQKDNDTAINYISLLIKSSQFDFAQMVFNLHNNGQFEIADFHRVKFNLIEASLVHKYKGKEQSYKYLLNLISTSVDKPQYESLLAKYYYLGNDYDKLINQFAYKTEHPEIAYYISSIYYRQEEFGKAYKLLNPFGGVSEKHKRLLNDIRQKLPFQGNDSLKIPDRINSLECNYYCLNSLINLKDKFRRFVIATLILMLITFINENYNYLNKTTFYIVIIVSVLFLVISTLVTNYWDVKFIYLIFNRRKLLQILKKEFEQNSTKE